MSDSLLIPINIDFEPLFEAIDKVTELTSTGQDLNLQPMRQSISLASQDFNGLNRNIGEGISDIRESASSLDLNFKSPGKIISDLNKVLDVVDRTGDRATVAAAQTKGLVTSFKAATVAARGLSVVAPTMSAVATSTATAGAYLGVVTGGLGAVSSGFGYVSASANIFSVSLNIIKTAGATIAAPFKAAFGVISGLLGGATKALGLMGSTVLAGLKPIISMASAYLRFKTIMFQVKATVNILSFAWKKSTVRMKAATVATVALAAAGKTGEMAMSLLGKAASVVAFAVAAATNPLLALTVSIGKMISLAGLATRGMKALAASIVRVSVAAASAGVKGMFRGVSGAITGVVSGLAKITKGVFALAVAGAGWGIKLAADAEQAQVGFATMLKSGEKAKALLIELETFAASTPFNLSSLRDGAKQLLNAGVSIGSITDEMRKLGDIAAGTGKPIGDFVRIFSKVKSTGKVSLETLNQLAERGVPIYDSLADGMGKSRKEMLKMISSGSVGFGDLSAAIDSMSTGTGVFAGGMAAQSKTLTGLFSTLKDNLGFFLREIGTNLVDAFNVKGGMDSMILGLQSMRDGIASAKPMFNAFATTVKSAFRVMGELASATITTISSTLGTEASDWQKTFVTAAAVATYAFDNMPEVFDRVVVAGKLMAETLKEDMKFLFTDVIPSYIKQLPGIVSGEFEKVVSNITGGSKEIVSVISKANGLLANTATGGMFGVARWLDSESSGKSAGEDMANGFATGANKLVKMSDRLMTPLEKSLTEQSSKMGKDMADGMGASISKAWDELEAFRNAAKEDTAELGDDNVGNNAGKDGEDGTSTIKKRTSFVVEGLQRGTQASLDAIYAAGSIGDKLAKKSLKVAEKAEVHLKAIAENTADSGSTLVAPAV